MATGETVHSIGWKMENVEPRIWKKTIKIRNGPWSPVWLFVHHHNKHLKCLDYLLDVADPKLLSTWLSPLLIAEARSANGQPYPSRTLGNILSGFLRYIHSLPLQNPPNFLSKDDPHFKKLLATCENVFRSLCTAGVGVDWDKVGIHQALHPHWKPQLSSWVTSDITLHAWD